MNNTPNTSNDDLPAGQDLSVPIESLIPTVLRWTLPLLLIFPVIYCVVWDVGHFLRGFLTPDALLLTIPALLILAAVHELSHALGWILFARISPRHIRFNIDRKTLSPYAHSKVPMRATPYRIAALLPTLTTAILPGVLGVAAGNALLTFLAAVMLAGALGDFIVLRLIRDVPGDALVLDHPSQVGCIVLADG